MKTLSIFAAGLVAAAALSAPASAQVRVFGGDETRGTSTRMVVTPKFEPVAMLFVQHGTPPWKPEYDQMIAGMKKAPKAMNLRLGQNYWSSFTTSVPVTIGGATVPAGQHYLGLRIEGGKMHVSFYEVAKAHAAKMTPWMPKGYKSGAHGVLELKKAEKATEKLLISLRGETMKEMSFNIHWGKYQLTAPIRPAKAGSRPSKD